MIWLILSKIIINFTFVAIYSCNLLFFTFLFKLEYSFIPNIKIEEKVITKKKLNDFGDDKKVSCILVL